MGLSTRKSSSPPPEITLTFGPASVALVSTLEEADRLLELADMLIQVKAVRDVKKNLWKEEIRRWRVRESHLREYIDSVRVEWGQLGCLPYPDP